MVPHIEIQEKLALEHRQHLQLEAKREHLLARAGLRRHSMMSYLWHWLSKLFVAHSSSIKPVGHIEEFVNICAEESGREPELQEIRR